MRHILFPVDFSVPCENLVPVVAAWAERYEDDLTLLHVQDLPVGAIEQPNVAAELGFVRAAGPEGLATFLASSLGGIAGRGGGCEGGCAFGTV